VIGERGRGAVLYGCALALLAAGGTWWVLAAPRRAADPRIEAWERAAQRLLPATSPGADSGMVALAPGADHDVLPRVEEGNYTISVVCVGGDGSEVRVSLGNAGTDSGMGLQCAGNDRPESFSVAVAGELRLRVSVGEAGPVVFRYALFRG
jgi:Family of unknown function (DUF6023)